MNEATKAQYLDGEVMPSGMVVEEVAGGPGTPLAGWPFEASRFTVPPGATSELDRHRVSEVWMVRAGTGTVRSEDRSIELAAGDCVYFPSFVPHQVTNSGDGPLEVFSLWWSGEER
ncbi:cupin domain-containing protein [Kitasatospora aureofaciens]|uniref:cupin domain-containing protein n=1 Tax=Kitasatospora aureofaciens TaxID=1894 RepID=UPI0037CB6B74